MTFFEKISVLRKRRGLSERALAQAMKIDPSAVSRWGSRGNLPRPAMVSRIADYFGVSVDDLTDDSKPCPQDAFTRQLADLKSASQAALKNFPDNPSAAQQNFDAAFWERAYRDERKERERIAKALRDLADSISTNIQKRNSS